MTAGVLCLQGSVEPHLQRLQDLGEDPVQVRQLRHLDGVTHLVIPGGESTTLHNLLVRFQLWQELIERHRQGQLVVFGTCAGAILVGKEDGQRPPRMGLLDATLARNAFGTQVDSFAEDLALEGLPGGPFHCVFIRAPRFCQVGPGAEVLARLGAEPILVRGPGVMASAFHPELTADLRIHREFLAMRPTAMLKAASNTL